MNELARVNDNAVVPYDSEVDIEALRDFVSQSSAIFPGEWMRFRKGDYLIGQDQRKASVTEPYVMNVGEVLIGWIKLVDGVVTERIVGRLSDKFRSPHRDQLGDQQLIGESDDPWKPTTAIVMRDATGEVFTFTSITTSGRRAVMDLINAFLRKCRQHPGQFPVVLLGVGTGRSKRHNSTYPVPVFKVINWESWDPEATASSPGTPQQGAPGQENGLADDFASDNTEAAAKAQTEARCDMNDEIPF